jgi:hypothetical protein
MIRARFEIVADDYRPLKWPIKHPYWCTGHGFVGGEMSSIIVAYGDDEAYFRELWPEITEFSVFEERTEYTFTERFAKPSWMTDEVPA